MKILPILILSILLTSCGTIGSMLAKHALGSSDKGVSVDAQIGHRQNQLGDQMKFDDNSGKLAGDDYHEINDAQHVTITNTPWWIKVFLLVGWPLAGVVGFFRWREKKPKNPISSM